MNVDFNCITLFLRKARIIFVLAIPTVNGMVKVFTRQLVPVL
jgi:hypothetical protein